MHGVAAPAAALEVLSVRYLGACAPRPAGAWMVCGQDGGQSVDLGDGSLFVFSDTLLVEAPGHFAGAAARTPGARVLANCAAVGRGATLRQTMASLRYFADDRGAPREILSPTEAERADRIRLWPQHGIRVGERVALYYLFIRQTSDDTVWGFENLGTGLACFDPRSGECERVQARGTRLFWPRRSDDLHFGVQALRDGPWIYVFFSERDGFEYAAKLARVHVDAIFSPADYHYFAGSDRYGRAAWSRDLDDAASLGTAAPEFTVTFHRELGGFLMAYAGAFDKTLYLRVSQQVHGRYGPPLRVGILPHQPTSELVYLAFQHPQFSSSARASISLSYCQPRFSAMRLLDVIFK